MRKIWKIKIKQTSTATISVDGNTVELPIYSGSLGPDAIDVRTLLQIQRKILHLTRDIHQQPVQNPKSPSLMVEKGQLLYRGYPIEQLADKSNFLEVAYLLIHGELPNQDQNTAFVDTITQHTMIHEQVDRFFNGFRRDAHPMAMICGTVGALSAFYHDSLDITDNRQRDISMYRLIAKMPTIAARAYKYSIGQPPVFPDNSLSYSENFLKMCFAVPAEKYEVNPVIADAMDKIFTLSCGSRTKASNVTTVRLAGSSRCPIHMPVLPLVWLVFGGRPTAERMKPV